MSRKSGTTKIADVPEAIAFRANCVIMIDQAEVLCAAEFLT
jgi:hypothetical protein